MATCAGQQGALHAGRYVRRVAEFWAGTLLGCEWDGGPVALAPDRVRRPAGCGRSTAAALFAAASRRPACGLDAKKLGRAYAAARRRCHPRAPRLLRRPPAPLDRAGVGRVDGGLHTAGGGDGRVGGGIGRRGARAAVQGGRDEQRHVPRLRNLWRLWLCSHSPAGRAARRDQDPAADTPRCLHGLWRCICEDQGGGGRVDALLGRRGHRGRLLHLRCVRVPAVRALQAADLRMGWQRDGPRGARASGAPSGRSCHLLHMLCDHSLRSGPDPDG